MNSLTSQLLTTLAWMTPVVLVMVVGIVIAFTRWYRHTAVSALLVASMSAMIVSYFTIRLAILLILTSPGGATRTRLQYVGMLSLAMAVIRAAVWGGMIAAMLGWRQPPGKQAAPLQFSIRGLIVVTLAVALLCGAGRALVGVLGDMSPALVQLADDLPAIVCFGIGIWIAAARWRLHPQVSHLAIWALGLALAVTIVPQVIWVVWSTSPARFTAFSMLISLGATLTSIVSWSLAIAAALGWRGPVLGTASAGAHESLSLHVTERDYNATNPFGEPPDG
jgi:hypothetical protein